MNFNEKALPVDRALFKTVQAGVQLFQNGYSPFSITWLATLRRASFRL